MCRALRHHLHVNSNKRSALRHHLYLLVRFSLEQEQLLLATSSSFFPWMCCCSGPSLCFSSLVRVQVSLSDPAACWSPSNWCICVYFQLVYFDISMLYSCCAETSFVMQLMGKYKNTNNVDYFEPLS